jgi:hypothetical protein
VVPDLEILKGSVVICVGYNGYGKGVLVGLYNGETYAVDSNGAFGYEELLGIGGVLEGEQPTTLLGGYVCADSCSIYMPLYDMPIEWGAECDGSFEVDGVAYL